MNNPFESIDARLANIESLLIDIKHTTIPELDAKRTSEYLSRKDLAIMLKVNLSTIHNWGIQGIIKKYSIGGRIYYKRDEVESVLKQDN